MANYTGNFTFELPELNIKLPNASEYYYDQYSRNDESRFILEKRSWKNIKQNNSSGKYLTDKELEYVGLINGFLKKDSVNPPLILDFVISRALAYIASASSLETLLFASFVSSEDVPDCCSQADNIPRPITPPAIEMFFAKSLRFISKRF